MGPTGVRLLGALKLVGTLRRPSARFFSWQNQSITLLSIGIQLPELQGPLFVAVRAGWVHR